MSLASSAALPAACVPATAQLLLPTNDSSSSLTSDGGAFSAALRASAERRSNISAPGIGPTRHLPPATGASHSVPSGCRKSNSCGGNSSRSFERAISFAPLESLRLRYIENATSTESSTRHGAGLVRSNEYSHGLRAGAPAEREVDTCGVRIEQLAIDRQRCRFTIAAAMRRKPWMRNFSSISSSGLPSNSASSPAAARRMRSIWKKRSCAVRVTGGESQVRREAARMVGVPSASRSIGRRAPAVPARQCRRRAAAGWRAACR